MRRLMNGFSKRMKLPAILLVMIFIINGLFGSMALAETAKDRTAPEAPVNLRAVTVTTVTPSPTAAPVWTLTPSPAVVPVLTLIPAPTATPVLTLTLAPTKLPVPTLTPVPTITLTPAYIPTVTPRVSTPAPTAVPAPAATAAPAASPVLTVSPAPTAVPAPTTPPAKIVGYYAAWASYSGYTPDSIAAGKLTHINYAFANIGRDLKIALGYPDVDASNIAKLNALKKDNPGLKTVIAVGGWSWSGRFSDAALTDASRTAFADSCVAFVVKYGFDGIDIDWEYPVSGGLSTNKNRPGDKHNFTLLMQKLREKLDARGATDGKHYLLSFAGATGSGYLDNIEPDKLLQYVDYVNVMTYDLHGSWDQYTDFNAPLYDNTDPSPQYKDSANEGIKAYLAAGFPASKLIMGVPFYGYIFKAVKNANNGLYQTYSGSVSISYANVAANYLNNPDFKRYFHTRSLVPWLFDGSTFITYEDSISMGYKASYIKSKGLGGAMIWELSQDPDEVLLSALYNALK